MAKSDTMDYAAVGLEEGFVQTRFGRIHFIHKPGKTATVLLLHGLGATVRTWERFMRDARFEAYAIDMLGHGESAKPQIDYTVDVQVSSLKAFVDAKCDARPFVMGNSYGGWVAAEYVLRNKAAGLIIEDGVVLDRYEQGMTGPAYISPESKAKFLDAVLMGNGNDRHAMESIIDNYSGMRADAISRISAPTLVMWGRKDDVIRVEAAERLHTLIKGSALIILENAGHVPHFSDAEEAAAKVAGFVNGVIDEGKDHSKG